MTRDRQPSSHIAARDDLVVRLQRATLAFLDVLTLCLGDELGFYRALAAAGPLTALDLASRTATHERYVREWLEQQAASGILEVDAVAAAPEARRYLLPPGHAEVLVERESLAFQAARPRSLVAVARALPLLVQAFRTGAGVPAEAYGPDLRTAQSELGRAAYLQLMGADWLPRLPHLHRRLHADPPARVADIGCGAGWSSIAIARAYPKARVHGFDVDPESIALARVHARQEGVTDRVAFQLRDAADATIEGSYDLVMAFETIHDMARPIEVLRTMRRLANGQATVIVADERVAEAFEAPAGPVDRVNYGWSVLLCLPNAMVDPPSATTGAVMRPSTLRRYATQAGFRDVTILPIEHEGWYFYQLHP